MAADAESDRTPLDRLLVGRRRTVAVQHLRLAVAVTLGQAVLTTALWLLRGYGLPRRNVVAFAAMLAVVGVAAAVGNGYRNGGVLVSVVLALAPLAGLLPLALLTGSALTGRSLVLAGAGVWAGGLSFLVGAGLHRLRARAH